MAEIQGYYRHPAIHGDRLVFVCEDDLWTVPVTGGVPRRLTASPGTVSFPCFSPDGRRVAFTGRDEGPAEAYVVDADGGEARRVTWLGSFTATVGWSKDGQRVLVTSDAAQPFRGYYHLHAVAPDGTGAPTPLRHGPARAISYEPTGKGVVIGRNSGDPARWKRYRGGTAGTIWIDRQGDGAFVPLVTLPGNLANPMWIGGRVWFLSDHEGHGNLYSCTPTGADLRRGTSHEDFYVRFPSTDGTRIVYHAGADLFVLDPRTGVAKKVALEWHSGRSQRQRKFVPAARHLESADLHPDGHTLLAVDRGGVHAMGLWDGPPQRLDAGSAVRHRLAQWLPDGKRIVAVSDEGGEEGLVILAADGSGSRRIAGDFGRALELSVAPAGADRVALANERQELFVVDLAAGTSSRVERSEHDRIEGLGWSSDGQWLAYAFPDTRRTTSIHLLHAPTGKVARITRSDFRDRSPSFDPEGRWLYFVSYRVFDPVYDAQYFDLGFPRGARPYLVTLRADVVPPFAGPARAPRGPAGPGDARPGDASGSGKSTGAPDSKPSDSKLSDSMPAEAKPADVTTPAAGPEAKSPPEPVRIELEGIEDRVVPLPVPEGRYVSVVGAKGRALFLSIPVEGALDAEGRTAPEPPSRGLLEAYDVAEDKVVPVAERVSGFSLAFGGKALLVRSGNRLRAILPSAKASDLSGRDEPSRETGWVDLDRLRVSVVPSDEWRQMFREAWRLQRDQFWSPDVAGIDWPAVHDRYAPLVDRVGSRAEFSDLMWEMQGELNTSHCYEMGGDYRPEPAWHQGFLGADLALDAKTGAWTVTRLPRGDSWDPARANPLAAPPSGVRPGDHLVAVDGRPVGADVSPAARLVGGAGRDVRLTVRTGDAAPRTISVRTLRDEQPLRYRDWVEANRERVHRESGGRLGYVHVPNMGPLGYSEFHRYYLVEVDRPGLVIDVRWNGGGHVSQLLLEKLARVRRGYNRSRWMSVSPYPDDAPSGPLVAITNEYAGSDGDIFSHCFKLYGLGPLIGKRTWGGVVGIWPRHALVDGAITTQPEFAYWFKDVGFGVEGHGTDPDIEVEITPQDHATGRDPQLERGIAEGLKLVEAKRSADPIDLGPVPSRRPPRLPAP